MNSTIHDERASPQVAKKTFANPPVNLIAPETALHPTEILERFITDPDVEVVVFGRATPDFLDKHFDLAAAADFPASRDESVVPVWTDFTLPGFLTGAAGTQAMVERAGIDFEGRFGEYIGIASQQR